MESSSSWIKLNVGGRRIVTTRDTLTRMEPHSVLARMFSESSSLEPAFKDEKGFFCLDRSPEPFEALLLYLRCGVVKEVPGLKEEAQFWGYIDLLSKLQEVRPDFPDRGTFVRAIMSADPNRSNEAFVGLRFCGLDLSNLVLDAGFGFQRCDFSRCNLSGVRASNVLFSGSKFDGACLDGAVLVSAAFSACSMTGCSFKGALMNHAILQKAQIPGGNFTSAKLSDAHLQDANLRGCVFESADLTNAHLGEADMRGVVSLNWKNLGESPFVRNVWLTAQDYAQIDRPDKEALRLRVISEEESESMKALKVRLTSNDFCLFVLPPGQARLLAGAAEV